MLEGVRTKDNGFYLMENVNGYYKCIGLKTIFKNILWKNDKTTLSVPICLSYLKSQNF